MTPYKIGEIYETFDELLEKIELIKSNYNLYVENIKKSLEFYSLDYSMKKYYYCISSIFNQIQNINLIHKNNIIVINSENGNEVLNLDDHIYLKLSKGENIFTLHNKGTRKIKLFGNNIDFQLYKWGEYKINNSKTNVLFCSDSAYYVGLFAAIHSLIENNNSSLNDVHFNFIITIEEKCNFSDLLSDFENKIGKNLSKTIIYIEQDILDPCILKSQCYNSGGHLLNIGNISRLLIGEFMEYDKILYLDCDSIVQYDILQKLKYSNTLELPIYCSKANREHIFREKRILIRMNSIIKCEYDWLSIIGFNINGNDYAYMGAPFIANCKLWKNVYKKMIEIINIHNNSEFGVYNLFTMSIQNIIFYNNTGDINNFISTIQDLGSLKKKWDYTDLVSIDVLDWSGMYKPWYKNGLYKYLWSKHDILNLSDDFQIYNIY
jgi:lipopolysaccharide biosynthesis glycosyltransferase